MGGDGELDANAAKGMDPGELALEIVDAVSSGRSELIAGAGIDAKVGIWLRALAPSVLFSFMRSKVK